MSTPPHPAATAAALRRTLSPMAQAPVPGTIDEGSIPPSIKLASRSRRSSIVSEFASEFVPNTESPAPWWRSHLQNLKKSLASQERSGLNGVSTGAMTPGSCESLLMIFPFIAGSNVGLSSAWRQDPTIGLVPRKAWPDRRIFQPGAR